MRSCCVGGVNRRLSVIFVFALFITITLSSPVLREAESNGNAGAGSATSGLPINELSWVQGRSNPVINGHIIFPPLASLEPAESYYTHWYAGSIYPSSLPSQNARSIGVSITLPSSEPRLEEFYYVVLSAFDSNGSYDQIGFSALFGSWGLSYSWTSGLPYPGSAVYHFSPEAMILSPGVTYTFNITTQTGVTHFIAFQGSSKIWSLDAPTGGNYLILSNYYSAGKRGRAPYDYTDYEEVYFTSTPEGAPNLDFNFCNNTWMSADGSLHDATWTPWYSPDEPFLIPNNVKVIIKGDAVLVKNPNTWWPAFHHDSWHNGYSISTAPSTNNTIWTFATSGSIAAGGVQSSPAVVDGRVFVGSCDNKTYALNATTGALLWNYSTGGCVESSPAVASGVVFVGSDDNKTYALNATTGKLVWSYAIGGRVYSSPAVAGGVVFVGSMDRQIYALNATTGALLWNYSTGGCVESSPAVASGVVFVGSDDGKVYALNSSTGTLVWSNGTEGSIYSSPAVADGMVFVGSRDNSTYAFNATTGTLLWTYKTGGMVLSSPTVAMGMVFVGSDDHKAYALNASTGAYFWSYSTGGCVESSAAVAGCVVSISTLDNVTYFPAITGGIVFVGSCDNRTYALNATTGKLVWSDVTRGCVSSSPAVSDDVVYVGSRDGKIYAFGLIHNIAVASVAPSKSVVGQGYNIRINITTTNLGSYTETFNVTVYVNTTAIGTQTVTSASGDSTTITFTWNTKGFAYGNYTIRAYSWPVLGETDTADNALKAPVPIEVTIPGDIDGNRWVNILDVVKITSIYGFKQGNPQFNPNCDIDGDGKITILDVVACTSHYGQKWQ
jgi:outer membrane protein assembly factor BamB